MIQPKLFHRTSAGASDLCSSAKSYQRCAVPPKEEERRWGKKKEVGGEWGGEMETNISELFVILVYS